ncbi:PREDICTED: uncharacterized protein LOC104823400 [Tarenaya hassleriana]|uniref:uncharacterized protein LOC104823400 n=1 Tax=Tarenaya hassleriana TaxID=28532 RepID=UPI00053C6FBB|nr:PREDICTED: uncharacterized protein LOC104823400 [Tarenaya hassleriana]
MEGSPAAADTTSYPKLPPELFGSREYHSPSAGIFASLFAPPHKGLGTESVRPYWNLPTPEYSKEESYVEKNTPNSGYTYGSNEGEYKGTADKETKWFYEEQRMQHPCNLSSSIYYGGQDILPLPRTDASASGVLPSGRNNSGEDDGECVSRGNWWKGSLYY